MKSFKLKKDVKPGGYMQFWTESKPPCFIVTKFPKPKIPLKLFKDVHPPSEFVEFVYSD